MQRNIVEAIATMSDTCRAALCRSAQAACSMPKHQSDHCFDCGSLSSTKLVWLSAPIAEHSGSYSIMWLMLADEVSHKLAEHAACQEPMWCFVKFLWVLAIFLNPLLSSQVLSWQWRFVRLFCVLAMSLNPLLSCQVSSWQWHASTDLPSWCMADRSSLAAARSMAGIWLSA